MVWTVGPIPQSSALWPDVDGKVKPMGKEVIVKYSSGLKTTDGNGAAVFYTDSNAREMVKRVFNARGPSYPTLNVTEPVAGNYYPVRTALSRSCLGLVCALSRSCLRSRRCQLLPGSYCVVVDSNRLRAVSVLSALRLLYFFCCCYTRSARSHRTHSLPPLEIRATTFTMSTRRYVRSPAFLSQVNALIAVTDDAAKAELAVLVDRAMGGASLASGDIELMLHRRVLEDDRRGVQEPLNETMCGCSACDCAGLTLKGRHFIVLDGVDGAHEARRLLSEEISFPSLVGFAKPSAVSFYVPLYFTRILLTV